MENEKEKNGRHSIRLKEYDYSKEGYYFITICTKDRQNIFGQFQNGKIILNEFGEIVKTTWFDLPNHNSNVELDYYCIMPNHFHGIIIINDYMVIGAGSKPAPNKQTLSEFVRQLKTFSSKRINEIRQLQGVPVWQRNYYEHIIRNEKELYEIRKYIEYNPIGWMEDEYFIEKRNISQ
jgi:REP element-mobilizing transposase RayT